MCGRYTISHTTEEILERFQILAEQIAGEAPLELEPRYSVAPSNMVPVVVTDSPVPESEGKPNRLLQLCRWGLVPFWVKDLKGAKPIINARAESLTEKSAFKKAFIKRRCIIPSDGFYEWKKDNNRKIPMRIRLADDKLFGFAGIYEDWKSPEGKKMRTVAIITVPPNETVQSIHDRMPAILTPEMEQVWLDPDVEDEQALYHCLQPYPYDDLEAYVVSSMVNKVGVNTPEMIQEAPEPPIEEAPVKKPRTKKKTDDSMQLKLPLG